MWLIEEDVPEFIERDEYAQVKCENLEDFLNGHFRPHHKDNLRVRDFKNITFEYGGKHVLENGNRLAYVVEGDEIELKKQYEEWRDSQ